MKSKQLANILIKMLGLSVCLYAIPACVSGILYESMVSVGTKTDLVFFACFCIGNRIRCSGDRWCGDHLPEPEDCGHDVQVG